MSTQDVEVQPDDDMTPELLPPRPLSHHIALSIYWLSNTVMWGALFHVALASQVKSWFGEAESGLYMGILGFSGGIVAVATQIVVGAYSDRSLHPWGRRRPFLVAGTMLGIGALLLLGAARSFWPLAGALVLVQLFTNIALGPFTALLPDTINPREHGKASGFMGIARLLGDTGGLILAGMLLSKASLGDAGEAVVRAFQQDRMFLLCAIMAAFMFVTMVYTAWAIRERPLRLRPEKSTWEIIAGSFDVDLKGNPDFFWLSLSRAVTNVGFYMFLEVLLFYAHYTLGDPDPERTTMIIMLPAIVAAALSSVPAGILSDRIGRRRLIYFAQFLMALGALGFALGSSVTTAMIAAIPAGVAYGVFTAVEWALACNLLPRGESARYLGVWNASAVVPQVIAWPIAGVLGSAISGVVPGLGWRVDFGLTVVCCLVGAWFLRHVHERAQVPVDGDAAAAIAGK